MERGSLFSVAAGTVTEHIQSTVLGILFFLTIGLFRLPAVKAQPKA
jgi:hypothetical protein